ncbi:MAG: NAD-dependent epimerase [Candidatus Wallbacteria bacterium]|nr:NAD-dependent epimerase [Candidatus Wallbacteria bacterium]
MKILVTGTAGFIGNHVALRLLERGDTVVGLDNLNAYYDPALKLARLARISGHERFLEERVSLEEREAVAALFERHQPDAVINLAAQAGVRYSLQDPHAYVQSNLQGFLNILEGCRHHPVRHLVYASSSSVYGANTRMPFSTSDETDHPLSLYGASKKANELMAHAYSHLFSIPSTGLRFFTVYGPWGRPDMALFLFTRAILEGRPIDVYNHGKMRRDFTYIDDIVEGLLRVLAGPPAPGPEGQAAHRVYNVGNHSPVELGHFIEILESKLGRKAVCNYLPMQPGDVPATFADVADLERDHGFHPATPIELGIERFVEWYRHFYEAKA